MQKSRTDWWPKGRFGSLNIVTNGRGRDTGGRGLHGFRVDEMSSVLGVKSAESTMELVLGYGQAGREDCPQTCA